MYFFFFFRAQKLFFKSHCFQIIHISQVHSTLTCCLTKDGDMEVMCRGRSCPKTLPRGQRWNHQDKPFILLNLNHIPLFSGSVTCTIFLLGKYQPCRIQVWQSLATLLVSSGSWTSQRERMWAAGVMGAGSQGNWTLQQSHFRYCGGFYSDGSFEPDIKACLLLEIHLKSLNGRCLKLSASFWNKAYRARNISWETLFCGLDRWEA